MNITFTDSVTVIPAAWLNFVNAYVNSGSPGVGTVTAVQGTNANGFAFSIANPNSVPNITLSCSVSGLLKGNGTGFVAAVNTDLPAMTNLVGGAVPTPPNNTTSFLRGDGTWAVPPGGGGSGTVTTISVATANGFAGTVATPTTTPVITLTTSVNGIMKGNGTLAAAAVSGTDYAPGTSGLATGILKSTTTTGVLSIAVPADFPTLNQNTTGTAAGLSATLAVASGGTGTTTSTGTGSVVLSNSPALTTPTADGYAVGYKIVPQNSQSVGYTTVLGDSGKHILHPTADVTARTFTIDSNANVPYPIGTELTFVNQHGAGVLSIAITADTMYLAGSGATGTRTLAANGVAVALKLTATEWIINGTGLT